MTEPMIEMTEQEVPEFADELSDEALDRVESTFCPPLCPCHR